MKHGGGGIRQETMGRESVSSNENSAAVLFTIPHMSSYNAAFTTSKAVIRHSGKKVGWSGKTAANTGETIGWVERFEGSF